MGNKKKMLLIGILTTLSIIGLSYFGYLDEKYMEIQENMLLTHPDKANTAVTYNVIIPETKIKLPKFPQAHQYTIILLRIKVKFYLIGVGVLILVAYYIFQDSFIPSDADDGILEDNFGYEITDAHYDNLIPFDKIAHMSDAEFNAWFEEWIREK
jgi:hypothetical protein